jgi:hypothetical protein
VEWRRANGVLTLEVVLPKGVDAEIVLDTVPGKAPAVTHNQGRISPRNGLRTEKNQVGLRIGAGSHTIQRSGI